MKPMLAAAASFHDIRYPLLASPKLDGVRALITEKGVLSRSLKPIPNRAVQSALSKLPVGYDGELIVGSATSPTVYRDTVSMVMSADKLALFTFYVFDTFKDGHLNYSRRFHDPWRGELPFPAVLLEQRYITREDELREYEEQMLDLGYEGLILRRLDAPYKHGRSTLKEGYLLKLKRFEDSEAVVIGFEELMHNGNEAKINELGRTARSSHKENKYGLRTLGALVCRWNDVVFNIGTGFDAADRDEIWKNRDKYMGKLAKFKYFPIGMKDAPRHPVWLGWRDRRDM